MRTVSVLLLASLAGPAGLLAQPPVHTNSVGMEFVLIRSGTMVVGRFQPPYPKPVDPAAPAGSAGGAAAAARSSAERVTYTPEEYARIAAAAAADSTPGFAVSIDRPYYIGKYEVTQAEWKRVMGRNPSIFQGDKVTDDADRHPVENVTWNDAQAFIRRLNAMEKTTAYRLPTEFEWEYAARAGAEDDIPWSAIREQAIAGYNVYTSTHMVGEKKPNAWGVYDTLGNVWEWVQDYYNEKIFPDPIRPRSGTQHVLKGGGFAADVKNATYMTHAAGPGSKFDVGFRLACDVKVRP